MHVHANVYSNFLFFPQGIPYASPPIANFRWKLANAIWNNSKLCDAKSERKAIEFASKCFQINPITKKPEGDEDCLYLNIWTPQMNKEVREDKRCKIIHFLA